MFKWFASWQARVAPAILPDGAGAGAASTDTPLHFEKVANARDLGGLTGAGGRRLRSGRQLRSGNPGLASADDIARLRALSLDLVVDFRSPGEKSAEESGFGQVFHWVATPVLEGSMAMGELLPRLRTATAREMDDFMLQVYRDFPLKYQEAFGGFMKHAEAGRSMLYHCTAGKDRTGFATLLLLSALGVAPDVIEANYLESNRWNAAFIQGVLQKMAPLGIAAEVMMPLLEVKPAYLQASLQAIEEGWGSVPAYVGTALGVEAEQLRAHYLEG